MAWQVIQYFKHIDIWKMHSGSFTKVFEDVTLELAGNLTAYMDEFSQTPQSSHLWTFGPNQTGNHSWEAFESIPKGVTTFNLSRLADELELVVGDAIVYSRHNEGRIGYYAVGWKITSISSGVKSAQMIFYYNSGWNTLTGTNTTFSGGPDSYGRYHYTDLCFVKNVGAQPCNIIYIHSAISPVTPSQKAATQANQYGLTNQNLQIFYNALNYVFWEGAVVPTDDPYPSNNYDEPIQGPGDNDDSSDTIEEETLPTISGCSSGFCTAYVPTLQQINALADQLIDPTWYQALGGVVLNVADVVIGLQILPCSVPYIASDQQLQINFIGIHLPTGLYINKAEKQYIEIDCGSLAIGEYWGNCLDYNPYTKISIFLPFCGFYELDTDDVMGKTIHVKYRIDIISGSCLATILVNGSVMYQYSGNCASQVPLTSVSFDQFLSTVMNVAVATATGAAGLEAAGAAVASAEKFSEGKKNHDKVADNAMRMYDGVVNKTFGQIAEASANAVLNAKGQYKHAGSLCSVPGFLGIRKPYLIIKRPNQMIPDDYGLYHGYPTYTKANLGDLEGYTEVSSIRLNIPQATVDEILECEKLLMEGVVL